MVFAENTIFERISMSHIFPPMQLLIGDPVFIHHPSSSIGLNSLWYLYRMLGGDVMHAYINTAHCQPNKMPWWLAGHSPFPRFILYACILCLFLFVFHLFTISLAYVFACIKMDLVSNPFCFTPCLFCLLSKLTIIFLSVN